MTFVNDDGICGRISTSEIHLISLLLHHSLHPIPYLLTYKQTLTHFSVIQFDLREPHETDLSEWAKLVKENEKGNKIACINRKMSGLVLCSQFFVWTCPYTAKNYQIFHAKLHWTWSCKRHINDPLHNLLFFSKLIIDVDNVPVQCTVIITILPLKNY